MLAFQSHIEGHLGDLPGMLGEVLHRNYDPLEGGVVGEIFRLGKDCILCLEINGVSITSKAAIRQQGCQIAVERLVFQ